MQQPAIFGELGQTEFRIGQYSFYLLSVLTAVPANFGDYLDRSVTGLPPL